jgi:hypothetical protein
MLPSFLNGTDPLHISCICSIWKILHFYFSFSLNPSKSTFFHALTLFLPTCCLLFLNSAQRKCCYTSKLTLKWQRFGLIGKPSMLPSFLNGFSHFNFLPRVDTFSSDMLFIVSKQCTCSRRVHIEGHMNRGGLNWILVILDKLLSMSSIKRPYLRGKQTTSMLHIWHKNRFGLAQVSA